ncbi:hypothetical protein THIOKS1850003 [Thiocapsa sp. KS1]|nr:tubulin-like doman-containing protein [Thiocapsa sp. KS1]CRI67803.1 hypothetical protein THIOKS1850003 [Thiocapsa sp. KS1]
MSELAQPRPTLLVGVGGIGCWLADRVYAMSMETGIADSGRIGILGFDTDSNDLHKLNHLKDDQLVQSSTAETVFSVLGRHGERMDEWFVDDDQLVAEVRQMVLLDGAGQIRMLSRMAFDVALQDAGKLATIDNAISAIASLDNRTQFDGKINVLIVGSLAGGTGSGMFLQTALLLGGMLRARGITPEIRGLFLLPDILTLAARLPTDQIPTVRANGYAALKELNAIGMQTRQRTNRTVRFEYAMDQGLKRDAVPFTSVTLLDYESQSGGNLGLGLEAYRELAAKAAYTLLFSPVGGTFNARAVNDVRAKINAAFQGGDNSIVGLGLASIVYPQTAMLEYLALSYGLSMLHGHWLRLDDIFRADMQRYHARVANGETNLEKPTRGESFVRNLEHLALQERVRFFRDLHAGVYRRVEDDRGNETQSIQFEDFLDALERHVIGAFWQSSSKLKAAQGREDLGADALSDKHALADDVRVYERQLKADFNEIERGLAGVVHDLFHNSVIAAMFLGETEWKDYHLESYLLRGGPHLLQVRYFLYQLRDLITQRTNALTEQNQRTSIETTLREAFDDPNTKPIESALDVALQRTESAVPEWLDKRFREFASAYREHYNNVLAMLRKLAEEGTKRQLYHLLDNYVVQMLSVIERFFDDLNDLKDTLTIDVNRAETAHSPESGLSDGSRYVFADRAAKQRTWADLRVRIEAASYGADKVNAALTQALIERFRAEGRTGAWEVLPAFSGNALFREQMVEGHCRETIARQFADSYRLTALEAMRREAVLAGRSPDELMDEIVALVANQSAPLLALSDPLAGQGYRFWTISPANEANIGNAVRFQALFAQANGNTPLVEPEFPDHTLSCLSMQVNLMLRDLRKLNPGLSAEDNVSAAQRGIYYAAYRTMVDSAMAHERHHPGTPKSLLYTASRQAMASAGRSTRDRSDTRGGAGPGALRRLRRRRGARALGLGTARRQAGGPL